MQCKLVANRNSYFAAHKRTNYFTHRSPDGLANNERAHRVANNFTNNIAHDVSNTQPDCHTHKATGSVFVLSPFARYTSPG